VIEKMVDLVGIGTSSNARDGFDSRPLQHTHSDWWPGTESNGQGPLKTGKLLIFQRPKKPKNLQKPVWRYIRGTRKLAELVSTNQHLAPRIPEKEMKASVSAEAHQKIEHTLPRIVFSVRPEAAWKKSCWT
jgi:hypothetical protein